MAKEERTKNEKGIKDSEKMKERKAKLKHAREVEKKAMLNEKRKIEEQIDELIERKKATKDKFKKKEINAEIKELKIKRSRIGKKDTFWSNVMAEMRLVRWPSKAEVFKYSIATLVFILVFALFFFGIDALFALVKDLID